LPLASLLRPCRPTVAFSRREASAASEAVGWKRGLGGYRFSQGLLPMNSFTAAILSFSRREASAASEAKGSGAQSA